MSAMGDYLQTCRNAAGLTQPEVAQRLDVSVKTVSDWEAGRYAPGFDLMARLIRIIGGQIEEAARLLLDDEPVSPEVQQRIDELESTEEGRAAIIRAARRHLGDMSPPETALGAPRPRLRRRQ